MLKQAKELQENVNTSEKREILRINNDIEKINSPSSKWYYASLILLNIMALIVCFIVLDNTKFEIQKLSVVAENFDFKLIAIMTVCFIVILLLKTLPVFLRVYSKTKARKFGAILGGVVASELYGRVTLCSKGKDSSFVNTVIKRGIQDNVAIDSVYARTSCDRMSFVTYTLILMIAGIFAWIKNTNVLLFVIGVIILLIEFIKILFVLMFKRNKKNTLEKLAKVIRFAYQLRIISDYEKVYNRIVDKLIIAVKDFKTNKYILFVEFISNMLIYFLKAGVVYVIFVSLNIADGTIFGELLFKCVLLELILKAWPIQNGTFIYELIFVLLMNNIFFEGYVFWGLVLYRLFDYFAYVISYLIFKIFDKIYDNKMSVNK